VQSAEVARPDLLAVQVVAVDAERAERDVQAIAVGRRRAGGVGVREVVPLVRHLLGGEVAPHFFAGLAVEGEDDELVVGGRGRRLRLEARVGAWAGPSRRRRGRCRRPSRRRRGRPRRRAWHLPPPGRAAFHLTLVRASQVTGGSAFGAVPSALGPRQWCQLSARSSARAAVTNSPTTSARPGSVFMSVLREARGDSESQPAAPARDTHCAARTSPEWYGRRSGWRGSPDPETTRPAPTTKRGVGIPFVAVGRPSSTVDSAVVRIRHSAGRGPSGPGIRGRKGFSRNAAPGSSNPLRIAALSV